MTKTKVDKKKFKQRYDKNQGYQEKKIIPRYKKIKIAEKKIEDINKN